jgi:protein Tob/BTG
MIDPILDRAAGESGIKNVLSYFPNELTMWVDPSDVSYRIGENGSVGKIYDATNIPSKADLTTFSQESTRVTGFNMISSCKSQIRDLVSSKHGNYAFTPFAAFVTS